MDSEKLGESKKTEKLEIKKSNIKTVNTCNDFPSMFIDFLKKINIKIAFFLSILSFFVLSDFFIENLPLNSGFSIADETNSKGAFVQLITIVIGYIIIDLLTQCEVI